MIFSIDPRTLDLRDQKFLQGEQITAIRESERHIYAIMSFHIHCGLDRHVKLNEIGSGFELREIFQSQNVTDIDVSDFAIAENSYILVGGIRTFMPTALVRESMTLEQLKHLPFSDPFSPSFWEKNDQHTSAFVLVIDKNAKRLADRSFPDVLNRYISNVIAVSSDQFVAVGSALGDRGWAIGFSLTDRLKDAARAASTGSATRSPH